MVSRVGGGGGAQFFAACGPVLRFGGFKTRGLRAHVLAGGHQVSAVRACTRRRDASPLPTHPPPAAETSSFLERGWKDMTERFFLEEPWPSVEDVTPHVSGDAIFLALYRLLAAKHVLTTLSKYQPATLADYADTWNAYVALLKLVGTDAADAAEVPVRWTHQVMSDIVWYYQTFSELRAKARGGGEGAGAVRTGGDDERDAGDDDDDVVSTGGDDVVVGDIDEAALSKAWNLLDVLATLQRAVDASGVVGLLSSSSTSSATLPPTLTAHGGYFALCTLARLHTKIGDYGTALDLLRPLNLSANEGLYTRIPRAHLTLQYYAAWASIMTRRFDDAFRILNRTLASFQRNATPLLVDKEREREGGGGGANANMRKTAEKMLSLLTLCSALLPGAAVEDNLRRVLRDRHPERSDRIAAGGETAEREVSALFDGAAPGYFVLSNAVTPTTIAAAHRAALWSEVASRVGKASLLRSYLRLYANIPLAKLGQAVGATAEETR